MAISLARPAGESAIACGSKRFARHFNLVKMNAASAGDLDFFVPLASDQNNIIRLRLSDGQRNGFAAVWLNRIASAAALQSWQGIFDDGQGIFAARIVGSQHHKVTATASGLAHQGTLALITIAAAAEERDHPAGMRLGCYEFARQGCKVAQCVVGVRIIHDHRKWLPNFYALETPGRGLALRKRGWQLFH